MRLWVPATVSKLKRALKSLSIAYVLLLVTCFVALILLEFLQGAERTEVGCYLRTAMITGAHCRGFMGAGTLEFILNLPVILFYAPLLGVSSIIEGSFVLRPLIVLGLGLLLWSPIIYFPWLVRYGKLVLIVLASTFIAMILEGAGVI